MNRFSLRFCGLVNRLALAGFLFAVSLRADVAPFTKAKLTEVQGDVTIAPSADVTKKQAAKLNDIFNAPDFLQTGRRSRVQLTADDGTIARVGSNTLFSLDPSSRTINLKEGSILFNSPKGIGGGTIVTNSATATVTGTTIIVAATQDGGFKVLVLEGTANVTMPDGKVVTVGAGQMTFVLPAPKTAGSGSGSSGGSNNKGGQAGPVLNFDLGALTKSSGLVNGFEVTLPSTNLIVDATNQQNIKVSSGDLSKTGQVVVGASSATSVTLVDSSVIQAAVDANKGNLGNGYGNTPFQQALATTLDLSPGATVPPANIFLSPVTLKGSDIGVPGALLNSKGQLDFTGLAAGTINVSTGNSEPGTPISLSALDGLDQVGLFASYAVYFSSNITTFTLPDSVTKFGIYGRQIIFYPGMTLTANFTGFQISLVNGNHPSIDTPSINNSENFQFELSSLNDLVVSLDTISNPAGRLSMSSLAGNVSVIGSHLNGGNGEVELQARQGALTINGSTVSSDRFDDVMADSQQDMTIAGSTLETGNGGLNNAFMELDSWGNFAATNSSLLSSGLQIASGSALLLSNITLSTNVTSVQLAGVTVNLNNIAFRNGISVFIYTKSGQLAGNPNTGATFVPGDLNLQTGVTYGGNPAQNAVGGGIILGVTADNPTVQSALGTAVDLTTDSVSSNNIFENVFFTPSNLGMYNSVIHDQSLTVQFGVIAGTLNVGGDVDLDNISNPDEFNSATLVGLNSIKFSGQTDISVPSLIDGEVDFWSRSITFAPGTTLSMSFGDGGDLGLDSLGVLNISHATILNPDGGIFIGTYLDDINLTNANLTAGAAVDFFSGGDSTDLNITNSQITADNNEINGTADGINISNSTLNSNEGISFTGNKRGITLDSVDFTTDNSNIELVGRNISVNQSNLNLVNSESSFSDILIAQNNITVTNSTLSNNGGGVIVLNSVHNVTVTNGMLDAPAIQANSGDQVAMSNVDVSSASSVNMSARTIVLSDINFKNGSTINLSSDNGLLAPNPNTNKAPVVGDVNFIKNVNYGGQPAQNFVPVTVGGTSNSPTNPIHISSRNS